MTVSLFSAVNFVWGESVATLALGSQPRQGLAKVRAKSGAQESHVMLPKVYKSVRK